MELADVAGRFVLQKSFADMEHEHASVIGMGDVSHAGSGEGGRGDRMRKVSYANTLSARQMESLTAFCDTFLPSVDPPGLDGDDESVADFYRTSASMAGTPELVGGLMSERLRHPKLWLMRVALWALSTWIGTLFICGRLSVTSGFPFFHSFAELPLRRREEIVMAWSVSWIHLLRVLAKSIKFLVLLVFFTQVNEKGENLSWKAIGYCGPDPEFKTARALRPKKPGQPDREGDCSKDEMFGPLHRGVVDMTHSLEVVADTLRRSRFPVALCPLKYNTPKTCLRLLSIRCDAVVVGSGSGGSVVAGVLAKAGYKVIVLEKGNYHARTNLSLLEGPTMDQMYLCGGLLATEDMSTLILAGSTVGGGSAINWSASIRTPQDVMDEWSEQHELELFGGKLYQEAMDAVCKRMGVQSEIDNEGFNNAVLRRGCQELGYPVNNIPRNSGSDHYCGWCCMGCKDGRKKGTPETWLLDLIDSGNGLILPGCEAVEILHGAKKNGCARRAARGVLFEFECNGVKKKCAIESKVTIVACGALSTPQLLRKSGLRNPNIGRNLHLHPVAMAWGYFPDEKWPEMEKKSYTGGIMTAMSTVAMNMDRSGYGAVIQTPALHPGMFSVLMPWTSGTDIRDRMRRYGRTAHVFALARDRGSGTVLSLDSVTYRMDKTDEVDLQRGLEKALRILAAAGAAEIGTHNYRGRSLNVMTASSHRFERFVREESRGRLRDLSAPVCSAHQMGSCRMGTDPESSAVNPVGETWEVQGLYVADTSVFPTALGVNPMVTVQAIAYCTAQAVLEALKRKKGRS
ncbi:hypothetical protein SAY87_031598 [Trapa incisa]|uniref:long-chain-alcohol oxidase n=1 Tax=Trapa incisa TaxID=236973 RepID=A0AAN7KXH8_9MYRT|nr:hypothetical protein SAY87_031598 [Trapa incisa]